MKRIKETKFIHHISEKDKASSDIVYKDVNLSVRYWYDLDGCMVSLGIKCSRVLDHYIHNNTLFLLESVEGAIKLVYSDCSIRIFKSEPKSNYIITVL